MRIPAKKQTPKTKNQRGETNPERQRRCYSFFRDMVSRMETQMLLKCTIIDNSHTHINDQVKEDGSRVVEAWDHEKSVVNPLSLWSGQHKESSYCSTTVS